MDLPTQSHLTTLRDLLTHRLRELGAEIDAAELDSHQPVTAETHDVTDRKDEATRQQLFDLTGAQEQRDVDELKEIEAALHRLDAGTYGDCAACAEPIPLQRLLVMPAATRCAPCQAAHEDTLIRSATL